MTIGLFIFAVIIGGIAGTLCSSVIVFLVVAGVIFFAGLQYTLIGDAAFNTIEALDAGADARQKESDMRSRDNTERLCDAVKGIKTKQVDKRKLNITINKN